MKNGSQSPAGLKIVDFSSELENTKGAGERTMYMGERPAWLGGRRQCSSPSGHEGHTDTEEANPYFYHFVPRKAEFLEQQADIGKIHTHGGVALWLGLRCLAQ